MTFALKDQQTGGKHLEHKWLKAFPRNALGTRDILWHSPFISRRRFHERKWLLLMTQSEVSWPPRVAPSLRRVSCDLPTTWQPLDASRERRKLFLLPKRAVFEIAGQANGCVYLQTVPASDGQHFGAPAPILQGQGPWFSFLRAGAIAT